MRGRLGKRHPKAELEQAGDRSRHFDAREVEAVGLCRQLGELPLHVKKRGKDRGQRLSMNRAEAARRPERPPDGRLGLAQNGALYPAIMERARSGEPASTAVLDGGFDDPDFLMADDGQMPKTLLDRPGIGLRPPVELRFRKSLGQNLGLLAGLLKLLLILFQFRYPHKRGVYQWRRRSCRREYGS